MRPQITFPEELKRALNYHEKKVQKGTAELLHAHSFFKLPQELNFHDKRERLEDLMALNERADTKLIHISLNFHPSEKDRLTKEFYIQLADEYMQKIGFGNQPYLVYQHNDAGHPHVHVLSTLIQDNGTRISTHYIGKNVSEPVRKEMEQYYGFIPADKKERGQEQENQLAVTPQKIQAGKSATMRSITNVLDHVIDQYKYTSLHELNALLSLYNVKADRGAEGGRIYKNRGLTYVVIDPEGKALTKPVKASAFYSKPTLDRIESKFKDNEQQRRPDKKHVKTAVDWAMHSKPQTLGELAKLLQKECIDLVIRRNEQGRVYGMTYIDHEKKTVFNGNDLDKEYSAKRMLERLGLAQPEPVKAMQKDQQKSEVKEQQPSSATPSKATPNTDPTQKAPIPAKNTLEELGKGLSKMMEQLIEPEDLHASVNRELTEEEKRKKRRQQQQER